MPRRIEPADDIEELIWTLARSAENAVVAAGASVVPIGPATDGASLDDVDGLVLLGGGDVAPECYVGSSSVVGAEAVSHVDVGRDRVEVDLVRQAVRCGLPILAICRGMQILNVALGGTLVLDLPATTTVHHGRGSARELMVEHTVWALPGTRLAQILGRAPVSVWSGHHQGIDRLADGLVPSAHAADGLIEAVEHVSAPILGIQWHPEHRAWPGAVPTPGSDAGADPPQVFIDLVATAAALAGSNQQTTEAGNVSTHPESDSTP